MSSTRCFFRANIAQKSFWILLSSMAVLPSLASNDDNAKGLISHGELYDPVRYPYVVSLVMWVPDGVVYCTGSLISPLFVLTAAHCTDRVEANDIQLRKEFGTLTEYAILSGHPNEFENDTELRCKIIGFGCTEYGVNFAREGFITDALVKFGPWACKNPDLDILLTWREFLCSKPDIRMVCSGDSGGPMICNGSLYGIASHIYAMDHSSKPVCGSRNVQTRHLFVYVYRDWIRENMKNLSAANLLTVHQNVLIMLCTVVFHILL